MSALPDIALAERLAARIVALEIPTGQPIVYELGDDLSVKDRYYLSERAAG